MKKLFLNGSIYIVNAKDGQTFFINILKKLKKTTDVTSLFDEYDISINAILVKDKFELSPLLKKLKEEKVYLVAVEQDKNSVDYKKVKLPNKAAIMVGNEVSGVPQNILSKCDCVAEIPMGGEKESLNVSVATGIALFRILNI